ncbi:MAG TPA: hypothetical protein VIU15_26685 [Streptomyces sp.]
MVWIEGLDEQAVSTRPEEHMFQDGQAWFLAGNGKRRRAEEALLAVSA